jgi:predicted RNase H-like HicB family nuclease
LRTSCGSIQTKLTIIIAKEQSDYVAYCDELGISQRGRTPAEAKASVEVAILTYLKRIGAVRKAEQLN